MFSASRSALLEALKLVGQVVERRNTIPILNNIVFERNDADRMVARVSDLDIEATIPFEASIDRAFRPFTVPAHMLSDIVRKLPDGAEVRFEATDERLQSISIKSGRSKFGLPVLPDTDFPTMQAGELPFSLTIPAAHLARAISGVSFAISTEETRYYLNGIYLHPSSQPDGVKLVATDGHRLSRRFVSLSEVDTAMPSVIIPKKTVETILKHLPKEGSVRIDVSDAKIRIQIGDIIMLSKLIDGTFPDYSRLIPAYETSIEIEGKPLVAAIERVSVVSSGSRAMRFAFEAGSLKLSVNNPDAGNAADEVEYAGDISYETGFNSKYVTDALANLAEGTVRLELGGPGSPTLFRADGDHVENVIVLMPMRV